MWRTEFAMVGQPWPAHLLQILFPSVLKIGNWNRKIMNHFANHRGDPRFSRVTRAVL